MNYLSYFKVLWLFSAFFLCRPFVVSAQDLHKGPLQLKSNEVKRLARVTGKTLPGELFPNPNQTDVKYDLGGTDLGIAWDMGKGRTGYFFGDSYGADFKPVKEGGPGNAGNWRSNVLGISTDHYLDDGITFDTLISRQVIYSPHITDGTGSHTAIPTAAVHAGGKDYVHYMDIRKWGRPGRWEINFSALYESSDGGVHWKARPEVRFDSKSNFAQVGYAKKKGYVYMAGTVSGRGGAIYLARFSQGKILNQDAYEYWSGNSGWTRAGEANAVPIIEAPAGELSLMWLPAFKRWVITYVDEHRDGLVIRDAKQVTGPWSEARILVRSSDYPGLYGSYIHPVSAKGRSLYFLMSIWYPYNVFLMKAELGL